MIQLLQIDKEELRSLLKETINQALVDHNSDKKSEDEVLLKTLEVAILFNVSQATIHLWKKEGKLPFYKIGNRIYFKRDEVIQAMTSYSKRRFR